MPAAAPAIPPEPRAAAIRAITKNVKAQPSMANTPLLACSARFNAWAYRGVSKRGTCVKLEAGAKGAPSHRPYRVTKPVSRVLYRAAKRGDGHSSRASLAARLLQPTRAAHLKADWKRSPASAPPLFGLAPGGVCRAVSVTKDAVRSYRTLSPLPSFAKAPEGGLLSVALSLGSPPPEVIRHRASMEPGLSSPP